MSHTPFSSEFPLPPGPKSLWQRRSFLFVVLLLAGLILSACLSLFSPAGPARTPVVLPGPSSDRAEIAISPPSGYAGVYVQVVGNGWPANDLVLVALSDETGRSGILAASAANSNGQVTTGFLYPISPRWLSPGPHTIVAYTADGNLQATAQFQVTPGDGVTPAAATATATATATGPVIQTPTATRTAGATATATPSPTGTAISAPTPIVITDWRGDYWANSTLSGDPALVRNDPAVFFDWGSGGPDPALPGDQFSARWTRQLSFDAGVYHFFLEVDDGARLFIDDQLVLDEWRAGSQRVASATLPLAAGRHTLRVEYFERTGQALARFWWERQIAFTGWEGRYFSNAGLQGEATAVRDDAAINFDWGNGSPAPGIGADDFSVRWKRTIAFNPGRYRFYARMDDGLRARIDGQLIVDEWRDGSDRTVATEVELPGGSYQIEVEFYEKSGSALAAFWWEVAPQPTPTHTPSWTPTSLPSATPTATEIPTQTPTASPEPTATETATATATATPTATATEAATSTPTPTLVSSGGTPTPLPEIGESIPFVPVDLPLLLPPKDDIFVLISSEEAWNALLDSLRPPKSPRPNPRPTTAGRAITPTATATATESATPTGTPTATPPTANSAVTPPAREETAPPSGTPPGDTDNSSAAAMGRLGQTQGLTKISQPDFDEQVVLAVLLSADKIGQNVEIVDVRQEANELFVKVRISGQGSRAALPQTAQTAVIVRPQSLPPLVDLTVHFVDDFYQPLQPGDAER